MRRREFIALLGSGVAGWPFAARAQQPAMPVVGLLGATTAQGYAAQLTAFRQGLSEAGFVDGRNVAIEYRWAEDQYDRLPAMAADLVRGQRATTIQKSICSDSIVSNSNSTASFWRLFQHYRPDCDIGRPILLMHNAAARRTD